MFPGVFLAVVFVFLFYFVFLALTVYLYFRIDTFGVFVCLRWVL